MTYVITFEDHDGECESFVVHANSVELAVIEAKDKASEKHGYRRYGDSSVLSIIRK